MRILDEFRTVDKLTGKYLLELTVAELTERTSQFNNGAAASFKIKLRLTLYLDTMSNCLKSNRPLSTCLQSTRLQPVKQSNNNTDWLVILPGWKRVSKKQISLSMVSNPHHLEQVCLDSLMPQSTHPLSSRQIYRDHKMSFKLRNWTLRLKKIFTLSSLNESGTTCSRIIYRLQG